MPVIPRTGEAISRARHRLPLVIAGNALMRIAGGASGVLVGIYLADLANHGSKVDAALVGILGAVSFIAELIGSVPMGLASDAISPRALMISGSLLAALATQLFGMSGHISIFFLSRPLEGVGAAAIAPSLLAHLTDVTADDYALRARVMTGRDKLARECKGCPGTFCKGCHGTGHKVRERVDWIKAKALSDTVFLV